MNKLLNAFLVLLCLFLATVAAAGPSILQIYMGGTGASTAAQALINLIGGSPTTGQELVWSGSAWIPGTGSSSFNPNSVTIYDEFLGGATTQALGWTSNGGGGGVVNQPNPSGPGLIEVNATNSNTTWEYLELGLANSAGNDFNPQAQTFKAYFRADNEGGGTNGTIRLGLFDNRGVQNAGNGVYFESGTAQSNSHWWCVQESSSSITKADSGITAPTSTFHTVEIDASSTTTVVWKIDGTAVCGGIAGTNVPNANLTIAAEAASSGSTAPKVWLDYFRLDLTTTGR